MLTRLASTVAMTAAVAVAPALAQDFDWNWPDWDIDQDAYVDRDEFGAGYAQTGYFDHYDADADGLLDETEVATATYGMMDLDDDGVLTVDEWDTWVDTRLGEAAVDLDVDAWDQDGDGIITRDEFDDTAIATSLYADYDADTDGYYGRDEFGNAIFDLTDANDDDFVVEDEYLIDRVGI